MESEDWEGRIPFHSDKSLWADQQKPPKPLKRWSGRRGSNPRRSAWEIARRLKIKNIASMALTASDSKSSIFNGLL
jgi:hypothetical protein